MPKSESLHNTSPRMGRSLASKALAWKLRKSVADEALAITRSRSAVRTSFPKPEEVVPLLLNLAPDFAGKHFADTGFTPAKEDVLGEEAAEEIVTACANSDCWDCTLGGLKLDLNLFQSCVFEGVQNKGYFIARNQIPASPGTELYTVVMAIQGAKKKGGQ